MRRSRYLNTSFSRGKLVVASLMLVCIFTVLAYGTTPGDYRKNLQSAQGLIDQLFDSVARSEGNRPDRQYDTEITSHVRRVLPPSQIIEWKGESVETANQWLGERLDTFLNESDTTRRAIILTSIRERLAAIIKKIDEIEKPGATGRTKGEDKQKIAEILR